jgi:MoxR-like ATPase
VFKCNDGVLNSLLTALNERKYTNEGRTYPIPTISFFSASNEIPNFSDPAEKILEALYDRLELKVVTENISDRAKRLSVLKNKQAGGQSGVGATFTLDELLAMQAEVRRVAVPDSINELADDVCCELRKSGIKVSDRKLLNYAPIVQAKAWLEGRQAVVPMDLLTLRCYLWQKPGDRAVVGSPLNRLCVNPLQDKLTTSGRWQPRCRSNLARKRTRRAIRRSSSSAPNLSACSGCKTIFAPISRPTPSASCSTTC